MQTSASMAPALPFGGDSQADALVGVESSSSRHGYVLVAPLDDDGGLDPKAWLRQRKRCLVRRFWEGEPDRVGHPMHRPDGPARTHRGFVYVDAGRQAEEIGGYLEDRRFTCGTDVSIREESGQRDRFRLIEVRKACIRPWP